MFVSQSIVAKSPTPPPKNAANNNFIGSNFFIIINLILIIAAIVMIVLGKLEAKKLHKAIEFEQFKANDLKKKLKLALETIQKIESNPDLVHSREFNLDYLRMRMEEDMFHSLIVNRMKIKVTQIVTVALRPDTGKINSVGIVGGSRKINETFDVTYELQDREGQWKTRVLFRIQINLVKLPAQSSSSTITEILECLEFYLSPELADDDWQPSIQNNVVTIEWDQNAKPTPLLVLEQIDKGVNQTKVKPFAKNRH